ncbi:MAG: phosphoribosylanthranilate isomerase [Candidatus Hydrogenedentes bacterium]|nr:phosphoribosylanthranilate isomerase [Candidatus Hydrogenedentota bacterium]
MKVKICGITNLEDALAAYEAGADALGFVFAEEARKRNRYIDPEAARKIVAQLPPFVVTVAVTVNEPLLRLREYLQFMDRVQLHGEEPPDLVEALGHRAIKVFRPGPGFERCEVDEYGVRHLLVDTYSTADRGGTGATGDWDAARMLVEAGFGVILGGGLNAENVAEAIRAVRPMAVDTSGGVEAEPGKKDHDKLRRFIDAAKTSLA